VLSEAADVEHTLQPPRERVAHRSARAPVGLQALGEVGYVMRSQHVLFKQGDREPWKHMQEHDEEQELLPKADLDDGSLVYR